MKLILVIFLCLLLKGGLSAQVIDWQQSTEWKMYKIESTRGLRFRSDSLINYPFLKMGNDSIHKFLENAELLPKEKKFVWMDAYYASCFVNGQLHKINIGTYAGYFFDEQSGRYFQIARDKIEEWLKWLISLKNELRLSSK